MTTTSITIRRATDRDARSIERIAQREGTPLPAGDVLVAEVDGELWAAVELGSGAMVADPFLPSGETAELLRLRAKRLHEGRRRRLPRRWSGRHRPALRRA